MSKQLVYTMIKIEVTGKINQICVKHAMCLKDYLSEEVQLQPNST